MEASLIFVTTSNLGLTRESGIYSLNQSHGVPGFYLVSPSTAPHANSLQSGHACSLSYKTHGPLSSGASLTKHECW